ncbi:phage baseplate assembly protein V [Novosphingobium sp. CF614]|uniref:phage baseplate assembly protein V n=1 Tax=Novosphingobium sp. CF614 TaxID=1884364 RepID=UPI0008F14CF0|nr:phage baseplate assembly protein V [Novosphingobium sp. CF614]SFG08619.1 phage baseplate assembly protein V [Novosphingobium sp. CF614]
MKQQEDIPADLSELIRLGTIATVDLAAGTCTVLYGNPDDDDGGAETPAIRWAAPRAGSTRIWSPPTVGEQVLLLVPDGQLAGAVALLGITQDSFPPAGDSLTEVMLFADGARIAYDPEDHALTAILPDGGTATITAPGGLTINADVTITGNVTLNGKLDASEDVTADGISLKSHKHGNVQSGGSQTGEPV